MKFLNIKNTEYENLEILSSTNKSKRNIWLLPSDKVLGKTKSFVDYQNESALYDPLGELGETVYFKILDKLNKKTLRKTPYVYS